MKNDDGLTSSNGDTFRLVKRGEFKMNREKTTDADMGVRLEGEALVPADKRRFVQVDFRVESVSWRTDNLF